MSNVGPVTYWKDRAERAEEFVAELRLRLAKTESERDAWRREAMDRAERFAIASQRTHTPKG